MRMIRSREANQDRFIDHIRDFVARRAVEITGLCLLLLTAAGATALLTWSVTDPSLNHATSAPVRNFLGWPGAITADLLIQLFGLSAGVILIPVGYASLKMMASGEVLRPKSRLLLLVLGIVSLSAMAAVFPTTGRWPLPTGLGGFIGDVILDWLSPLIPLELPAKPVVGFTSGLIALLSLLLVAGIGLGDYEKSQHEAAQKRQIMLDDLKEDESEPEPFFSSASFGAVIHWFLSLKAWFARLFRPKAENDMVYDRVQHGRIEPGFDGHSGETSLPPVIQTARQKHFEFPEADDEPVAVAKPKRARTSGKSSAQLFETDDDGYAHPSLSLLAEPKKQVGPLVPPEALEQNARLLEGVLDDCFKRASQGDWLDTARAIMTTDTFPKLATATVTIDGVPVTINGIAKGAGMIAPDMATMLSFIFTDAPIAAEALQTLLSRGTRTSFNAITVDSDTSTSDTLIMFATGAAAKRGCPVLSNPADRRLAGFRKALDAMLLDLAKQIVRDGEGARHFVSIRVEGAKSAQSAKIIGKSVADSPLLKTAIAGEDANWGRIVAAIGKAGEPADRDRLAIWFGDTRVAFQGARDPAYDEAKVSAYMTGQYIDIRIELGLGKGQFTVYTCDLTKEYVEINGDYRS